MTFTGSLEPGPEIVDFWTNFGCQCYPLVETQKYKDARFGVSDALLRFLRAVPGTDASAQTFHYKEILSIISKHIILNWLRIIDVRNFTIAHVQSDLLGLVLHVDAFHGTQVHEYLEMHIFPESEWLEIMEARWNHDNDSEHGTSNTESLSENERREYLLPSITRRPQRWDHVRDQVIQYIYGEIGPRLTSPITIIPDSSDDSDHDNPSNKRPRYDSDEDSSGRR